jgi:hypothetical protein
MEDEVQHWEGDKSRDQCLDADESNAVRFYIDNH